MKVLNNLFKNKQSTEPIVKSTTKIFCIECGSELEIEASDCYDGIYGSYHVKCPCCNKETIIDDENAEELGLKLINGDDIEYPKHFCFCSEEAVKIKNDEITKDIHRLINELRKNNDEDDTIRYIAYGDTFIYVQRFDGDEEYFVIVAKNYADTYIPFNTKDYDLLNCR